MPQAANTVTFLVTGRNERGAIPGAQARGTAVPVDAKIKDAVTLSTTRGAGDDFRLDATSGNHYVVLDIKDGPSLLLHPDNAKDLLNAQVSPDDVTVNGSGEVFVPSTLAWKGLATPASTRGVSRGALGKVFLSAIRVVEGPIEDAIEAAAIEKIIEHFDDSVGNGVFALSRTLPGQMKKADAAADDSILPRPDGTSVLFFIHGTFSDTSGSFGKLWSEHPEHVDKLFETYGDSVYALDHPTLGVSPIQNALTLVKALKGNNRLHLVTHSRGGLVAEVLARICANPVIGAADEAIFKDDAKSLAELQALAAEVKAKSVTVDRIVRVACPVRGTLLASNRLDAYLSVLKWTLELAQVPVAPALVELLTGVAQTGLDPKHAPGLAAQAPDSALIRWVHSPAAPLPGDLRVVSGDVKGDSVTSWLKTLLSDAFFWTDNDFVVQTRSMYGGVPRERAASFLFDQTGQVSHFRYFTNPATADAITSALIESAVPSSFRTIGPLSWAGKDSGGLRGAAPANDPAKPALIVLPGILGSNLKIGDERVWLSWRIVNGLDRLGYKAGANGAPRIEPDGPIGMSYDKLIEFFGATHNVTPFAYDWRVPIELEAARLALAITDALDARTQTRQPVRIVAHSMGGLVVRAMQLVAPDVWKRLMGVEGARILMLGTPNGGSWAPMQVLSGDDTFGNTLAAVGSLFDAEKSRGIMAQMPGFLQLQAGLLDPQRNLGTAQGWQDLATRDKELVKQASIWHSLPLQMQACTWGLPPDDVLKAAIALRKQFDTQRADLAKLACDKLVLVVGQSKFTPDGYEETPEDGLVYLNAVDVGDGRVTLDSAMLPNVPTWTTPHDHGSLPKAEEAFEAYLDLLRTGSTTHLDSVSATGAARGAGTLQKPAAVSYERFRPSRYWMSAHPASSEAEMMASFLPDEPADDTDLKVAIRVLNGNVRFVEGPLMLGHYGPAVLTGAEIVMNKLLGERLSKALNVGRYPEAVGTQQIFINGCVNPHNPFLTSQPSAVIVVGLGEEGKLGAEGMIRTVRQGVIAWCQRVEEQQPDSKRELHLTATLLASGGMSVTPGDAAQGVVRGVCEANKRLALNDSPHVGSLDLIEIYLDRATEAWLAVKALPPMPGARLAIGDVITPGVGGLRRPLDSNYRSAGYDIINVTSRRDEYGRTGIVYAMDTRRARGELRPKSIQRCLLQKLIATTSAEQANNEQIGRTLFQLVVPFELRPFLGEKTDLVLSLDETTAGIPWELLQTPDDVNDPGAVPWAIRSQLLRKLQTVDYRSQVIDVQRDGEILIIGEPKVDLKCYPRLPGATSEAEEVHSIMLANADQISKDRIRAMIRGKDYPEGPDSQTIINTLFERNWRIVHIAGHGEPPEVLRAADPNAPDSRPVYGKLRGVVLSDDVFLGPDEIEAVGAVPELVFVNCCHLAERDVNQVLDDASPFDRPRFAATVAEMLIKIGVRCVIACGWAVNDEAARTFASTFYRELFAGKRFIDAVGAARAAARAKSGNTWAAYQCYGDPDWMFRAGLPVTLPQPMTSEKLYAAVASPNALMLALEHLSLAARYDESKPEQQKERIQYLESKFRARYGGIGKVAEAFARAWAQVGVDANAVRWYERAVGAVDGSASFESGAEWARVRARLALERFVLALPADTNRAPDPALAQDCIREVTDAAELLERLSVLRPSVKMETLTGSAWRRLANIERRMANGHDSISTTGIDRAVSHFAKAVDISKAVRSDMLFLPALKYLSASTVQALWKNGSVPEGAEPNAARDALIREIYASLTQKMQRQTDFWAQAALNGIRICEAVDKRQLAPELDSMLAFYEKLHATASAQKFWVPVYRQAAFVLTNYSSGSGKDERDAADRLNSRLRQWSEA
ncbi:CHAT domain protein [Caballeronia choica]|uniref:CHAT domain protein n=1 Tax=Caballeronia choica TaxID=326476 RepID=A0A158GRH6_9BURK|nr:CHAT domain-containing protein [Caballeronia choica]SAL34219.1 CHAT domain protein [Caballeronia choica]